MSAKMKLKDVFLDPLSAGIFDTFQNLDVPWKNEGIDESLDLFFITNYGERYTSPLTDTCLDSTGKLTVAKQTLLATALFNIYGKNWAKEYATLSFLYDPIENYSMEEKHTGNDTRLETPTNWKETRTETVGQDGYTETETQTPTNWKETRTETVGQDGYTETETQTPTNWKETRTETVGQDGYTETETQTPTNWKESKKETVGQDGYTETETQTPTQWEKTIESDKADNDVAGTTSLYAFNSSSPVPISSSDTQTDAKSVETQSGTYETKREISGEKDTDIERTGTYETKREIEGEKIAETNRTGTYETKREIEGEKIAETDHTGTYETKREIEGEKITETDRTGTYEDKTTYNSTLKRSGNIGVTTSQQMIESERELWLWNFFRDIVFPDVAKALTISLY